MLRKMFMLSYFPHLLLLFLTSHCALSVYSVCASACAALILTTFVFQGAPGTAINMWQPGPQVWSVSQQSRLITWALFASFLSLPWKVSSEKSQTSSAVFDCECVMSFVAVSLRVVGPTGTSWPPWPTWAPGCYRHPRTTGKRQWQLDGEGGLSSVQCSSCCISLDWITSYLWWRLSAWALGYFRKAMLRYALQSEGWRKFIICM